MLSYHTKAAVIKQFGLPDEKKETNGISEWLYNCDTISVFGRSKTRVAINGSYNGTPDSLKTKMVTQFTNYDKYIKFTFDAQGTVLKWDSWRVNFAERKKNTAGTIFLVLGLAAVAALLVVSVIVGAELAAL